MRQQAPARLNVVIAGALLAAALPAAELRGSLELFEGRSGKKSTELDGALIYFMPAQPAPVEPLAENAEIVTLRKAFLPKVTAVTVGSTVRFPNEDPILHNVFSLSGQNRFDLGLYRRGDGEEVTFEHPGIVRLFCNVHHSMVAYLLVLETPLFTYPDRDGRFVLHDLPAGGGTLTVWHERAEPWERTFETSAIEAFSVRLELTKPRVPRHTNKFGKPYARRKRGKAYN